MMVEFNHLLPAMPELGMGLPNDYKRFGFVLALFYHRQLASFGFTGHYPLASRSTPQAAIRWDQRGQVVRRPSPASYSRHRQPNWQRPNGPDLDERLLYLSMSPNQAIFTDKIICSSPLAAAHPFTVLSWPRRSTPVCSGVPGGWP